MNHFLASISSVSEAKLALAGGADIIDCKNPNEGALGAVELEEIQQIVSTINGQRPVSATVGDIHDPFALSQAIRDTHACGVDFVKFGLFDSRHANASLQEVADLSSHCQLIAVCFVDYFDPIMLLPKMAHMGITGVMLDTADKSAGRLPELMPAAQREHFVRTAQRLGLLCGLAGRLRASDIAELTPHGADYLGFRSALCGDKRTEQLQLAGVQQVHLQLRQSEQIRACHE